MMASVLYSWRGLRVAMLRVCFDGSGNEQDQLALVVAGFISSAKDWVEFEREWEARLNQDNISCFHMVEFAAFKNEFKGMEEPRRRSLLADLMDIIQRNTYELFGCGVLIQPFKDQISESIRNEFYFNAYSLAARTCASNVSRWLKEQNWDSPVEYIFEAGDNGVGWLIENFLRDGYPAPIFKPKRDRLQPYGAIEAGFTPLQAADFLAYEYLLSIKHKETGRLDEKPLRWAMEEFLRMDKGLNLRTYTVEDLATLKKLIDASKQQFGGVKFSP